MHQNEIINIFEEYHNILQWFGIYNKEARFSQKMYQFSIKQYILYSQQMYSFSIGNS